MKRVVLAALALVACAGFVALGIWQLERRSWKLDLIQRVDQRVHAAPVAAPGPSEWPNAHELRPWQEARGKREPPSSTVQVPQAASGQHTTVANDFRQQNEYRRVVATGHFLHDRETLVQAVTQSGAGFWVLTPLQTSTGFTVLINRGFVPLDRRDPTTRRAGQIDGETTITGLLRVTEPQGGFLRKNDPAANRWYSRDVQAIAAARGVSQAAPYFIDAADTPVPGGLPIGGLTVITFRNNHLQYALTWFTLAAIAAGFLILIFRRAPDATE
jgi:surfeit locus 1 family protein